MTWIMLSFQIAVVAYVYTVVLTRADMLLGGVYGFLSQIANDFPKTEKFLKPVMLCTECVTGQMALWTLILYGWLHIEWIRTVIDVLFFLSITIILIQVIKKVLHD